MTLFDFLKYLKGAKKQGKEHLARCPGHKDTHASLSVSEGDDGRILLKCHVGCSPEAITGALGLNLSDLFAEPPAKSKREIERVYDYRDESGKLLYQAVRFFPKGFSQRRPNGSRGWDWALNGTRRVLYRLPELIAANTSATVFIVEGEKDVDRLRSLGLTATTSPQGAGKWRDEFSHFLTGREVVILPDNDQPGRDHAEAVARSLQAIAISVRVLELPGLPEKGDVSDWLDAGGQVESLCAMVDSTADWKPAIPPNPVEEKQPASKSDQLLPIVRMADVKTQKVDWLWPNRIASHSLTIMEGIEGVGKSTLLCAIAAGVTLGQGLPESDPTAPGNVVWLSAEDDLARVLKPRLESAGVNCERVFAVGEPFSLNERGLLGLRAAIAEHQPKLVIIDPIFAFTLGDANKGNDSRSLTGELKKIAEQFACAICLVRHVGKSKGLGDPRAAGLYSIEWRAAARSVLLIGADPDQPQKRAITQTKNNLGPPAASLGYLIQSDPDSPSGARFFWTGQSDLTAERILSQVRNEDDEEAVGRREATDFLRDALSDGARPAKDIQTEARQCGISDRTLNRAKAALGIQSKKQGGTFSGRQNWVWELPPEDCQTTSEGCQTFEAGNLQLNGSQKTTYASETAEGCQLPISGNLQGNVGNLQADQEVF